MTKEKALTTYKRKPLTVGRIMPHVIERRGNISAVARALGVSRQTIYRHIEKSAKLQKAVASAREERIDLAESQLDAAVERGEPWAITLMLRGIGRERGYGAEADVNLRTDGEVKIVFGFAAEESDE